MTISLTAGDTYLFRLRADHNDGSVSSYATSDAITMQQAAAPTLSVTTVENDIGDTEQQELLVAWNGANYGGVELDVMSDAYPGAAWNHVWYGDMGSGSYPANFQDSSYSGSDTTDEGFVLNPGVIGPGTYTYRIRCLDAYGQVTAWSSTASGSLGGDGEGDSVDLSGSGTTITASWPNGDILLEQPDGASTVIGDGASLPTISGQMNTATGMTTATLNNLLPGTTYDFALWTPITDSDDHGPTQYFVSDATATTSGTAPIAAPAAPSGLYAALFTNPLRVALHWTNTSNNETSFVLQECTNLNFLNNVTGLGSPTADSTSFVATNLPLGTVYFRVKSVNAAGSSAWTYAQVLVHYPIKLSFNAFIPLSYGIPSTPATPWNWGLEPFSSSTYFGTDNRELAGQKGTSRIHTEVDLDSSAIGQASNDSLLTNIGADPSHQTSGTIGAGGLTILPYSTATGQVDPNITVFNPSSSSTDISVLVEGSFPFGLYAPPIIINIIWHLQVQPSGRTSVAVTGETNSFPAYEGLLNGSVIYSSRPPKGAGPSLFNLGFTGGAIAVRGSGSLP
jgi:hypothetical protein